MMQYDGAWTTFLPHGSSPPSKASFPVMTNGSVAVVPSIDGSLPKLAGLDSSISVIGTSSGVPIPTFNFCRIRAAVGSSEINQELGVVNQPSLSLDMQRGVFSIHCKDTSGNAIKVQHALRALLPVPGMVLHTITVTIPATAQPPVGGTTVTFVHEVRAPTGVNRTGKTRFSGDAMLANGLGGGCQFVLGAVNNTSACVSVYLPENTLTSSVAYNETHTGGRKAWTVLPVDPNWVSGVESVVSLHVLTAVAPLNKTNQERTPSQVIASLKRRLLGTVTAASPSLVAQSLIESHEAAWAARWNTWVDVPTGAPSSLLWALRYAFYNLHSCLRPSGAPSFVDLAGTTLGSAARGDDFLVNALLYVSPGAAKALLEERWALLGLAKRVAIEDGLEGARFPYAREPHQPTTTCRSDSESECDDDEDASNQDDPQNASVTFASDGGNPTASAAWASSPLRVYGTLMTAINVWNYFRVTKDIDWLADRGWPILKAAADLICSIAAPLVQPTTPVILAETPTMTNVVGMDVSRASSTNPAAVVAASVAVLRATVEASYALGYSSPLVPLWNAVRYGLLLPTASLEGTPSFAVVASDATNSGLASLAVPEPLVALMEPLASLSSSLLNPSTFSNNVAYWASHRLTNAGVNASPRDIAIGDLVFLQARAMLSQTTINYAGTFLAALNDVLSKHVDFAGFGNFRPLGGPASAPNDLGLSAQFVMAFVQGLGGATVQGGYTAGQLTYSPLGIGTQASSVLPSGWERLALYGVGPQQVDVVLLNASVGASGGTGTFVPWSVNSFA